MTPFSFLTLFLPVFFQFLSSDVNVQGPGDPWRPDQLIEPEVLAKMITDNKPSNDPVIFNIGPVSTIKGAITLGAAGEKEGITQLQARLKTLSKKQAIVVYCGCCPFDRCPNIRPAFNLLNKEGFENHKLLNLPHNVQTDWTNKGYPVDEE